MFGMMSYKKRIDDKLHELEINNKLLSLKIKSLQELIFQYFDDPKPQPSLKPKRGKV